MGLSSSIAVVVGLVGAFDRHVDVVGLIFAESRQVSADLLDVVILHHFVEVNGKHSLCDRLVSFLNAS